LNLEKENMELRIINEKCADRDSNPSLGVGNA
jgi:hypothetical protein